MGYSTVCNAGTRCTVEAGTRIEGGHYIPVVARRSGIHFVTWGEETVMTKDFYGTYCDEAWVALSTDAIVNGHSPEGFDIVALQADLRALAT